MALEDNSSGSATTQPGADIQVGGELDISSVLEILWRGKWLIAGAAVAALAVALLFSSARTPIYRATLAITPAEQSDFEQFNIARQLDSAAFIDINTAYTEGLVALQKIIASPATHLDASSLYSKHPGAKLALKVKKSPRSAIKKEILGATLTIDYTEPDIAQSIATNTADIGNELAIRSQQALAKGKLQGQLALARLKLDSIDLIAANKAPGLIERIALETQLEIAQLEELSKQDYSTTKMFRQGPVAVSQYNTPGRSKLLLLIAAAAGACLGAVAVLVRHTRQL